MWQQAERLPQNLLRRAVPPAVRGNASQMAYTGQDLSDLTFTQLSFDDGTTPVIVEETENNSDDTQDTVQDQQIAFSIVGSGNSTGSLQ